MSTTALPTPRALLTNLIITLSAIPSTPHTEGAPNPLQNAPSEVRSLLTTLHIIFPHLLLPALDLLDRQLVSKVVQRPTQDSRPHNRNNGSEAVLKENSFYMVQSSQFTGKQRRQKSYIVRLCAWNCTCASFVFSAFPPETSDETAPVVSGEQFSLLRSFIVGTDRGDKLEDGKWEFGGASLDGKGQNGGAVPACKHLLAAVLADRWSALGGMMTERWVEREEMAGLGAGF